ncbi:MAG TPA: NADH-quinone oxidoreductase subunit M [Actinomycetota bacterium]|nr:NADH-quinone oxidoreductase subunit M [Actinomycetota bacterium]
MPGFPILTVTLVLPVAGAIGVGLVPKENYTAIRTVALVTTVVTFLASLDILFKFHTATGTQQLVEHVAWVPAAGASYKLGVDGISLWMILLTTFLMPASVLVSYHVAQRVKAFFIVLLILETSLLGVFLSLDLALFYVFWEAMLVPMYFLIGIWGYDRRRYAAIKFFLYTLAGSLVMLVGVLYLYFAGGHTFDLIAIESHLHLSGAAQDWLFWAFFASFAIKVPIFPLHTWLPDAHTEAPTAGSVLLAGVLLKMGAYGFLRFSVPLFPEAAHRYAPILATLGVIGILYGGIVAIVQPDLKRLVAYSSVSHMGFVVLGIAALTPLATTGSVIVMLSHGLATGALFLLVGMLYDRAHTRQIAEFRGVSTAIPVFSGLFLFVCLVSLGLPGLSGFIGEFLVLNGSFPVDKVLVILGVGGILLSAIYLLWAYERIFTGPKKLPHEDRPSLWKDLSFRELAAVVPLLVMTVVIGVYPRPFLNRIEPSVRTAIHSASTVSPSSSPYSASSGRGGGK